MASQLMGKLTKGGNRSFHHGDTHTMIHFEDFDDWCNGYRHNNSNVNSLRNYMQSTSREETKEPPSSVGGETEK